VCGCQEQGVTACVGARSEAFQLLLNGLEFCFEKNEQDVFFC
jgi:hypothetical protein